MRAIRFTIFLLMLGSCITPYDPGLVTKSIDLLVIDGYVDLGGSAQVKLSRSKPVSDASSSSLEVDAVVNITSSKGETFQLPETNHGVYTTSNLVVDINTTYTLHVKTRNSKEYISDTVRIFPTPEIDNIQYEVAPTNDQLWITYDSHDDNNKSRFYLVDCVETWEFHPDMRSDFLLIKPTGVVRPRTEAEMVYYCWREEEQATTLVNTARLSDNIISKHRVSSIPRLSRKLQMRYSALVTHRAISADEYAFRDQLRKTTELMGSLFDVTPGPVVSNVRSLSDRDEYVVGYFRGQQLKSKRFFIDHDELPDNFKEIASMGCYREYTCPRGGGFGSAVGVDCVDFGALSQYAPIVDVVFLNGGAVGQVAFTQPPCGDCTAMGGTTVKPSFW